MDSRLELARVLMTGMALTGPNYQNVPVNSCPDDDPIGEPRPMKCVPVNDMGPLVDYILESGWLSGVRADAWDECLDEIEKYEINTQQAREGNPYREAGI